MDRPLLSEVMKTVTAEEFGRRIAQTFLDIKSSNVSFWIQQAFKDCDDDNGIFWEKQREMFIRLGAVERDENE